MSTTMIDYLTQIKNKVLSFSGGAGILKSAPVTGLLDIATGADLPTMAASGGSHSGGAVPDPGASAGTAKYLREDATWNVPRQILTGTRAARIALDATLAQNTEFYETDTTLLYVSDGAHWLWESGLYSRTFAQVGAFAATLGAYDAGLLLNVSDYAHILRWSGTAWAVAPGERLGGYVVYFCKAPSEAGWVLADGSSTTYLDILVTKTITPATTTVLTIANAAQAGYTVTITGATGAWAGLNATYTVSARSATTITIPFDSSALSSPITGSPILTIETVLPDLRP